MVEPVTVVIPARNAAATLPAQLAALARQLGAPPFRIVVVDNGSSDNTADVARSSGATVVQCLRPGVNVARNAGIGCVREGIVLLCDADDVVGERWVGEMTRQWKPGTWVAGRIDYRTLNADDVLRMRGLPTLSEPVFSERDGVTTFGGNCGFSIDMWRTLGGFDERLSGAGDETEFFRRASAAGFTGVVASDAILSYRLRPSIVGFMKERYQRGTFAAASAPDDHVGIWRAIADFFGALARAPLWLAPRWRRGAFLGHVSARLGYLLGTASERAKLVRNRRTAH
jgi:glycosyltransferase involved in cell wall biosynthesis